MTSSDRTPVDPSTLQLIDIDWSAPGAEARVIGLARGQAAHPTMAVTCRECGGRPYNRHEPRCEHCGSDGPIPLWCWDPELTGIEPAHETNES